jgi:hypothetical protein
MRRCLHTACGDTPGCSWLDSPPHAGKVTAEHVDAEGGLSEVSINQKLHCSVFLKGPSCVRQRHASAA